MTEFGTDAHRLARRNDPCTSKEAASLVDSAKLEMLVFNAIKTFGDAGCIAHDIESMFPERSSHSITPRFRGLLDKGLIEETGELRKGIYNRKQRVVRVRVGDYVEVVRPKRASKDKSNAHTCNALAWLLMSRHADDEHVASAIRILKRLQDG